MALSNMTIVSDGNLEFVSISFNYLDRSEINVYFDSIPNSTWAWVGDTNQIKFTPKVPNGVTVLIARMTDASYLRHVFSEGAAFTAQTLDEDLRQVLHIVQEAKETNLSGDFYSDIDMHGFQINNLGTATDDNQAVSLGQYRADVLGAGVARDEAEGYRDQTLAYRNQAEGFKNTAQSSATTATTQAGIATTQAGIATTQAGNASTSASNALSYRNTTLTYRNAAEGFRNEAEGFRDDAQQAVIDASDASRLTAGTVTTGSPGTSAAATITGPAGAQVLNLTLPRGNEGYSYYAWSTAGNLTNISSISGMKVGDYVVNTSGATRTMLGVSTAVGGVVRSSGATTGTAAGSILGPAVPLVQVKGTSTTSAMSQNAVTNELTEGTTTTLGAAAFREVYLSGAAPSPGEVMAASPVTIELNYNGSGNRTSNIDFHSRDGTNYDARIIKNSGASGTFDLIATNGSIANIINLQSDTHTVDFNYSSLTGVRIIRYPVGAGSAGEVRVLHNGPPFGTGYYTCYYGGVLSGSITAASSSSVSFNTTSDYRLKEQVLPMVGALDRIMAAKPVTYKWKSDGSAGEGFIAHELAEVVPLAVTGEKDAVDEDGKPKHQQVDYSRLTPLLTKGIQELTLSIQSLQSTIKELEDRITDLENNYE
ncbi:tail fiber protein [Bacteriophage Phi NF-1]|uniref:Tail fiber protein n=1 Tax=Bacteriophage Phi NF-1 TaxID=2900273 RepID=A0A976MG23_9CAUD|nr:tail fiber protein [Bacteriophage Phi NF-1]